MKFYAGIGSRKTPLHIQEKMTEIANELSRSEYCLRSGGADGADTAFELGATFKEIFLPWNEFNGRHENGSDYVVPPYREDYTLQYHPRPHTLTSAGKKFMSRNTYQVLGLNLNNPVEFVLCWTADGKASGGTGQALRIAFDHGIPIFNFQTGFKAFSDYMVNTHFFS